MEAIKAGVPVVCVPGQADQVFTGLALVYRQLGAVASKDDVSAALMHAQDTSRGPFVNALESAIYRKNGDFAEDMHPFSAELQHRVTRTHPQQPAPLEAEIGLFVRLIFVFFIFHFIQQSYHRKIFSKSARRGQKIKFWDKNQTILYCN
jgi:hypothetical protein